MNIYTFGDSHSYKSWEYIDKYKLKINMCHIGPKLCYSFGRDKLNCLNIKDYKELSDGNVHILQPVFIYQNLILYLINLLINL